MATSIFEVQVDDEAFKKFSEDFAKYTIAIDKLPMAWGRIEAAIAGVGDRIDAQTDSLSKVISATNKTVDGQRDYNRALRETAGSWGSIVHWTRLAMQNGRQMLGIYGAISSRITTAAVGLLKWATVGAMGAGLVGAGGLWGVSSLASGAGATRRTSQGLGLEPGELRAYETNFGTAFDPRSVLGNLSSARNDPDRRWALLSMGLDPVASTGELGQQAPLRAKQIYEEGGQSLSYARARGLLEIFSEEDLQRLHAMTVQEIESSRLMVEQDRVRMTVSDALARRWQSLSAQFDRAGHVVQTVFLDKLSPLAPEIEKLSDAFTEAVKTALSIDVMRSAINVLATGIRSAGDYISSNDFLEDIRQFGRVVESVWRAVSRVASWIDGLFGGRAGTVGAAGGAGTVGAAGGAGTVGAAGGAGTFEVDAGLAQSGQWAGYVARRGARAGMSRETMGASFLEQWSTGSVPGVNLEHLDAASWLAMSRAAGTPFGDIEARRGLPSGLLDRIWQRESARGTQLQASSAGALGHFQFMPATGAQYGLSRPEHFNDLGRSSEAAGSYMQDLMSRYQGDLAKATAAYNWGMRHVDTAVQEHGENWRLSPRMPRETRDYLAAVVDPIIERLRRDEREGRDVGRGTGQTPPRVDVRIENQTGARVAVTGAAVRAQ